MATPLAPSPRESRADLATELMLAFVGRRRRYLWTDAFAVCNFLGLARRSRDPRFARLAEGLVDEVHHVLGRHRLHDGRSGWISGLDDDAGELHPTIGGLRIGKPMPERRVGEPFDERLEWNRDGQYFHYLTKWMLALEHLARATGREQPLTWARELANTAFKAFTRPGRMTWKMSIDLSRPLVASMGQHDPLDGLVSCVVLDAACRELGVPLVPKLDEAIEGFNALVERRALVTTDPLGLGGLLLDACRLARIPNAPPGLASALLDSAATGLAFYALQGELAQPPHRRLAFRELGLAIGLAAFTQLPTSARAAASNACTKLDRHAGLRERIEACWMRPEHRALAAWTDHEDINDVMLATSLAPDGVLTR